MEESIRQALEIVRAQAGFRQMSGDEIDSMVRALTGCVADIVRRDASSPGAVRGASAGKITAQAITCRECGKSFKLLTRRHLAAHGLTPEEYRDRWGYARDEPLVCGRLHKERSRKMKDMKLWEKRGGKTR